MSNEPENTDTPAVSKLSSNNTNYNTAPDVFEKAIASLPEYQQEILRHWYFLGKEKNWSLNKLASKCGVSSSTLSRVFRGDYNAELDSMCEKLSKARANSREAVENPDFIMTSLANQMFAIFDRTRALKTVSFMSGEMGNGKTTNSLGYKHANSRGSTLYYRCEPGLTLVQFITEIAVAARIFNKKQTHLRLREKLYAILGAGNRLLIIDELHELFLRREKHDTTPVMQCEFLRLLFDKAAENGAGCGLSIISTEALQNHLNDNKEALAQLLDRGTIEAKLPAKPTKDDVRRFIKSYGLPELTPRHPEAQAIIKDILAASGLRKLTLHLRDGAAAAKKAGEQYAWEHFITAFDDISSISKKRIP